MFELSVGLSLLNYNLYSLGYSQKFDFFIKGKLLKIQWKNFFDIHILNVGQPHKA